jgi:hypothetical protein
VNRFALIAILFAGLLLSTGCAWSNNNAHRDAFGPDMDETTGKEASPVYNNVP